MVKKAIKKHAKSATIKAKGKTSATSKKLQSPRMRLTKGHIRKRNALRKSLGKKIADHAFAKWIKAEKLATAKKAEKRDEVAEKIAAALKPLAAKKINFGTYGYTIKRAKGKDAKGLALTKNVKPIKGT